MTLSRKDIVAIIGPTDETLIADILHMDATSSDLSRKPGPGSIVTRC
ncbi:hypothetical protein LMIY3S_01544 [Labrys miyagiensis]